MPDFASYEDSDDNNFGILQATDQELAGIAKSTGQGSGYNWFTTLAGDTALGAVDLVDTVASSTIGHFTGIQRGTINNKVLAAIGSPGLTDFYNRNRAGIEVASGIEGIIASEIMIGKAAKALTPLMGAMKSVPFAGRLVSLDKKYQSAMATVRTVDTELARTGVTGAQAWTDVIRITPMGPSATGAPLAAFNTTRREAANKAFGLSFGKGAVRAAASEASLVTFMNQNEFLFSEDYGQNMMWMGLGVGIGGAFNALGTGYAMRRFVNSDSMRRLKAEALDPTGQEAARLEVADLTKTPSFLGHLNGWVSDRVTSLMTSAKAPAGAGVDATSFNRLATQHQNHAFNTELPKLTNKGLSGVQGTAFAPGSQGYWNHVTGALHKDPGLLYGTEMMGGIAETATFGSTHAEITQKVQSRLAELDGIMSAHHSGAKVLKDKQRAAVLTELKNLKFQERLTPLALVDQELMPLSHAATYDNWVEPKILTNDFGKGDVLFEAADLHSGKSFKLGIESNGTLHLPGGKTLDTLDHFDMMRLYRSAGDMATSVAKRVGDPKFEWIVPMEMKNGKANYSWFHLDLAEEILRRTDGRANINFGTLSRESAQKESLIQKIMALKGQDLSRMDDADLSKLRLRYNLPRLTSYQMGVLGTTKTPLDLFMNGASKLSEADLRKMSLSDLQRGFAEVNNIGDLHKVTPDQVKRFDGNSFRFMLDDEGRPVKPILMYKRNIAPTDWTQDRLAERIGAKKIATASMLTGAQSGPVTRELTGAIMASPDFRLGTQVAGLHDTQLTSSIPGLANVAPQTGTGALLNSVVTAEWRARDNPVILAITRLRETIDRQMRGIQRASIEGAFGDTLTVLNGPRNPGSKALLDNFHTFRSGWDLEPKTAKVAGVNGTTMHGFVLSETQGNKSRWKQMFGTEMPKGQLLTDSRGKEIALDDLAMDIQRRFNQVTDAQRVEKNSLLASQGLPQIHQTTWYTPPPSVEGKYVGFVFDSKGEIVPGGSIVADTQDAFNRELSRMKADPKSAMNTVPGAKFRFRDEIEEFASIWDKAQMEMLNPGTTAVQGEKQSKGFLTGTYINANRFDDSLRTLRDQWLNHGNDLLNVMLDDQIKAAKSRSAIAAGITKNADSKGTKYRSVYDYWLEAARGKTPLASEGSFVGGLYNWAERKANDILRERAPGANRVWQAVEDRMSRINPFSKTAQSEKEFSELSNALGSHMPFEDAAEMIERRALGVKPTELADITGAGNRFTATWMLRMLEPAAAVMNLAGVLNAMPAVIRHVGAKPGETAEMLAQRIGHSANIFQTPSGATIGTLDMGKLAWRGFKRSWGRQADAEYDYMAKNGFLSQEVAEFQRQFNAVESKAAWQKWFTGDPTSSNRFAQKGIVGWLSVLTDKSEDFSRSWGHMIGLEVGEMLGITDKVAKHNFAHDIANKMIANYSPLNRPEFMQGAIGAPIGLFQSFMWNYYQRMFRYIETGDVRSIASQYAMQGTLFGAKSVPGWNELNNLFFENSDGESSPYDALYQKFGQSAGDLMMAGTLSNLPKLFGSSGVDLYSRGDVSPRLVTQNPITNAPVVSAMGKIVDGVSQGVHLFMGDNPDLSVQQVGEVLSNMLPNRPMAGMAEIALAGGYDTDSLGQVAHQTKTYMDATYRMLGLRSLQHSKELEAFYSNKQANEIQAAQRERFNTDIRGAIRDGNPDSMPLFIEKYLEDGGDPRQVSRMMKSAYEAATESRAERQLDDVMRSPSKMAQVQRLMDAQVGVEDDGDDAEAEWGVTDPLDRQEMPMNSEEGSPMAYGIQ